MYLYVISILYIIGPGPSVQVTPAGNTNLPSAQTLWIIIACVSAITALAIAALVAVLCRRKILNDRKKPANLKASNQAPKGMNKGGKQTGPDLWIDHDQVGVNINCLIFLLQIIAFYFWLALE